MELDPRGVEAAVEAWWRSIGKGPLGRGRSSTYQMEQAITAYLSTLSESQGSREELEKRVFHALKPWIPRMSQCGVRAEAASAIVDALTRQETGERRNDGPDNPDT